MKKNVILIIIINLIFTFQILDANEQKACKFYNNKDYNNALKEYKNSYMFYNKIKHKYKNNKPLYKEYLKILSNTSKKIARCYEQLEKYDEAIEYYHISITFAQIANYEINFKKMQNIINKLEKRRININSINSSNKPIKIVLINDKSEENTKKTDKDQYLEIDNKKIEKLKKICNELENSGRDKELAQLYFQIAEIYEIKNNFKEAIKYYDKSLGLNIKLNKTDVVGMIYLKIAILLKELNKIEKCKKVLIKCIKINLKNKNLQQLKEAYFLNGMVFYFNNENNEALINLKKCYEILEKLDILKEKGIVLYYIGLIEKEKGNLKNARKLFEKSYKILNKSSKKDAMEVQKTLSEISK